MPKLQRLVHSRTLVNFSIPPKPPMANLLVSGSLRNGGHVLLDDFSRYFTCRSTQASFMGERGKKTTLKSHKEKGMSQHPSLISQQGLSATQVCQFWENISRALHYLSHPSGHEHLNEFFFVFCFKHTGVFPGMGTLSSTSQL